MPLFCVAVRVAREQAVWPVGLILEIYPVGAVEGDVDRVPERVKLKFSVKVSGLGL